MKNQLISGLNSAPVVSALILACGLHLLPAAMEKGHTQEIVDYSFEGVSNSGPLPFGSMVSGALSVVPDATPDIIIKGTRFDYINQPGFRLNLNFSSGLQICDHQITSISFSSTLTSTGYRIDRLEFDAGDVDGFLEINGESTNLIPGVPNPWQLEDYHLGPLSARMLVYSRSTQLKATYILTDLSPFNPITNLIIDGVDSGILDFEVEWAGEVIWASEALEMVAASSRNHGQFVSRMAKFFNLALKQELISEEQKDYLTSLVAESK